MPAMLASCAASLAVGLAVAASAGGVGAEADRVVAVLRPPGAPEPTVITLSRVEEEARIALVSRGAVLAATRPLDGPALKAGLEWLVDQMLLGDEAARLRAFEIDQPTGRAELARFRSLFPRAADYDAFLVRCDLAEGELEAVLRRMLRVRRYVDSRVSHAAHVSEAEVTAWLEEHGSELGARDRDAARLHLAQERVKGEVTELLRGLRARADVRRLVDFDALVPPARPEAR